MMVTSESQEFRVRMLFTIPWHTLVIQILSACPGIKQSRIAE